MLHAILLDVYLGRYEVHKQQEVNSSEISSGMVS